MMTREEAIALLNEQYETCKRIYDCSADQRKSYPNVPQFMEALGMALSALRPVSRERVDKVWRGEWMALDECSNEGVYCKRCKKKVYRIEYANEKMRSPFCPACGAAQTDEAVEITMRRLEALYENRD